MKDSFIYQSFLEFDYLFIGLGAANCLLILRLHDNNLLAGKSIAIIEPGSKSTNDRTFCFWASEHECAKLKLQSLVSHSWSCIEIGNITKQHIDPLHYFHVQGIDLYNQTKSALSNYEVKSYQCHLKEKPKTILGYHKIKVENETIIAHQVFDSRPPIFNKPQKNQSHLYQSFYGFKIKSASKAFDPTKIVMMDFNVPQNNFTQFIYVLPFNEDTALIELTRFGEQQLLQEEAQIILNQYLKDLSVPFEIIEHEQGTIPMSSATIDTDNHGENWTYMGARANMLKNTTGYAFHAMAEDAIVQMEAIKNKQIAIRKPRKHRFAFYDRLLLKILHEKPHYGKIIFEKLFKEVPVKKVLSFLREQTTLAQEIPIFIKLPKRIFIQTALKDIFHHASKLPVIALPFLLTILSLILTQKKIESVSWIILGIGFLSVGLSHGAMDHLTQRKISHPKQLFHFILSYLIKGALLGLVWFFFPATALLIFICYSAWHFGQADFHEWGLKQGWQSIFWGFIVLLTILGFHFQELIAILQQIPNLYGANLFTTISEAQIASFQIFIVISALLIAALNKSKYMLFTLSYLLLSSMLPLLVSFGIYFVSQHSVHGWRHLQKGLNETSFKLWVKSLPFSMGGVILIAYFMLFSGTNYVGLFFIILSCLSLPHVLSMHHFYAKLKHTKS
ncbi:MAG: beta-carotene 15,15'-dioxygenase, Brp/Blh family [bacterium]|nr:beta-carotene 15,15'-dioxygenase, Brp/Blh family [bacterium]